MNLEHTALILVGYQNDYFAPDGILRSVAEEPGRVDEVLANTLALIGRLVDTPATLISTPIVLTPDYRALASPSGILHSIKQSGAFALGTPGADNIPQLATFGDRIQYVRGKVGFNAFSDTALQQVLDGRGIRDVLLAGMVTSLCIDSTGRAAYERGYAVHILADCCSARTATEQAFFCHSVFPLYASVINSTEVI
ncbi:MAG: cysteine hydrolase [Rhodoferax sp.]|nr:cysteine hydrolase [Rhodoferax sp.]